MTNEQVHQLAVKAGFPFNKFGLLEGEHDIDVYLYDFAILARADLEEENKKTWTQIAELLQLNTKLIGERHALKAEVESLRAAPQAVPAGWKLVPVEPTRLMMDTGFDHDGAWWEESPAYMGAIYKAMLAAAPAVKGA